MNGFAFPARGMIGIHRVFHPQLQDRAVHRKRTDRPSGDRQRSPKSCRAAVQRAAKAPVVRPAAAGRGRPTRAVIRSSTRSRGRPPVIASSLSRKREATVGERLSRRARVMSTSGAPSALAKSCADKADRILERGHAERRPDLGRKPRVGSGKRRPHTFVEAAEDHHVGALQPRFEKAPDEDTRVTAIRRAHRAFVEKLAKKRRGIFGADRQPRRRPA